MPHDSSLWNSCAAMKRTPPRHIQSGIARTPAAPVVWEDPEGLWPIWVYFHVPIFKASTAYVGDYIERLARRETMHSELNVIMRDFQAKNKESAYKAYRKSARFRHHN